MRFRILSLAATLCMALSCALAFAPAAKGQIRVAGTETAKPAASSKPAASQIASMLQLNLCVDGSAQYPCPPNILTDNVYVPAITLIYGQILDGVVAFGPADSNSGTITIYQDSTPVCTLRLGIDRACPAASTIFDVGDYTLSATLTFPAGSTYVDSDTTIGPCIDVPGPCNVSIQVAKDTSFLSLKSSATPAALGTPVTFTAVARGGFPATPTGNVVFSIDGNQIGTAPLDTAGRATYTTSTLALGMHTITASYPGALNFLPADGATIKQLIVPPATETTIASSLNPSNVGDSVTFTAGVATAAPGITPTGAVTFKDGTASFATVLVTPKGGQNIAQTTTSTLNAGTHSITAIYSGDAATSASVSAVLVQQVDYPLTMPPPGYAITVTPSPITMGTGQTAHLTVTVTPVSGFLGAVMLSCSNLPDESACTFGETTIPAGGGSTTLALSTMAPHDCGSTVPYGGFGAMMHWPASGGAHRALGYTSTALAGVFLLMLPCRRRAWMRGLLMLAIVCEIAGLSGCGSSNCTDFGTYPGSYTFKVNGAASTATPVTAGSTPRAANTATPNVSTSVALTVKL